jgi:hypothetical protein
VKRGKK